MCLLANTSDGTAHKNKSLIVVPMKTQGRPVARKIRKIGMMGIRHGADLFRRRARAAALPHRRGRHGLHLSDAAVPGRAPVGRGRRLLKMDRTDRADHRIHAQSARRSASRILDNQVVHFRLAELETEVERCARWSTARSRKYSPAPT